MFKKMSRLSESNSYLWYNKFGDDEDAGGNSYLRVPHDSKPKLVRVDSKAIKRSGKATLERMLSESLFDLI